MSLVKRGGKLLTNGGKLVTNKSCCCDFPCCPTATLVCEQVTLTLCKCGFHPLGYGFADPCWLTQDCNGVHPTPSIDCNSYWLRAPNNCCTSGVLCSGRFMRNGPDGRPNCMTEVDDGDCLCCTDPIDFGGCTGSSCNEPNALCTGCTSPDHCGTFAVENEFTDAQLQGYVDEDWAGLDYGACGDHCGGNCYAQNLNLSPGSPSCIVLAKLRFKFTFPDPLEFKCKICYILRTETDGEGHSDEKFCVTIDAGETETDFIDIGLPAEGLTITLLYPLNKCCKQDGTCTETYDDCDGYSTAGCCNEGSPCGACCFDGVCFATPQDVCEGNGGVFQGVGAPCSPDPCGGGLGFSPPPGFAL